MLSKDQNNITLLQKDQNTRWRWNGPSTKKDQNQFHLAPKRPKYPVTMKWHIAHQKRPKLIPWWPWNGTLHAYNQKRPKLISWWPWNGTLLAYDKKDQNWHPGDNGMAHCTPRNKKDHNCLHGDIGMARWKWNGASPKNDTLVTMEWPIARLRTQKDHNCHHGDIGMAFYSVTAQVAQPAGGTQRGPLPLTLECWGPLWFPESSFLPSPPLSLYKF